MTHQKPSWRITFSFLSIFFFMTATTLEAQMAQPRKGGNQKATVCQWMGEVEVCVTYNSPDVTLPSGKSRKGEIWGELIPYGMYTQPWLEKEGERPTPKPWRAGADESTFISFSHDVTIEGQELKAGTYGVFYIVGEEEWELVLSADSNKWGAYFYNEENDVLRVKIKPETAEYREWLTYDFTTRTADNSVLTMWWENLRVPVKIAVSNIHDVYLDQFKKDLTSRKMMYWYNWQEAAQYCLDNNVELEQGLEWIEKAINQGWIGEVNFMTLRTKSELLNALGRTEEAETLLDFALINTAGIYDLHNYGRELLNKNDLENAQKVFSLNFKKHPNYWVSNLGLARGYAAAGDFKKAKKYAQAAKKTMPSDELGVRKYAVDLFMQQIEKKEKPIIYLATGWEQVY